jgi:3',5'-cyclic AMP phosphodiesterase CpdA
MQAMRRGVLLVGLGTAIVLSYTALSRSASVEVQLPLKEGSVRFAVIGDSGTGDPGQYQLAQQMTAGLIKFPFTFVIMLGDNIYGSKNADAFKRKFEKPYADLLKQGVKFYASLGNHDTSDEVFYKPFNMDGKRFYSFRVGNAEFFALDSNYMDPAQLDWLRVKLRESPAVWKICYFHHALFSNARMHGSDLDLRKRLEPIFLENGVSVVLSGHDHTYERFKPQKGIRYFVLGNSGEVRVHDLRKSDDTDKAFDTDHAFMLGEIAGEELHFQTISRSGGIIDLGMFGPRKSPTSKGSGGAEAPAVEKN